MSIDVYFVLMTAVTLRLGLGLGIMECILIIIDAYTTPSL
jgi:hypothetical protein